MSSGQIPRQDFIIAVLRLLSKSFLSGICSEFAARKLQRNLQSTSAIEKPAMRAFKALTAEAQRAQRKKCGSIY